jgi:hypothetical protein
MEKIMTLEEVRSIAKARSIHTGKLSKGALIKTIQQEEGNFDCFGTASLGICDQLNCSWRDDCFQAARQGLAS